MLLLYWDYYLFFIIIIITVSFQYSRLISFISYFSIRLNTFCIPFLRYTGFCDFETSAIK